jgi:hypothetical protein
MVMARRSADNAGTPAPQRVETRADGTLHFVAADGQGERDDTIIHATQDALAILGAFAASDPLQGDPLAWAFHTFG